MHHKNPTDNEVITEARGMYRMAKTKGQISARIVEMFNGELSNERLLSFLDLIYPTQSKEQKK